jgi:hypothetical protein
LQVCENSKRGFSGVRLRLLRPHTDAEKLKKQIEEAGGTVELK